ncbi:spectrin beta chain, non-erythrocytic 1 isoform X2 [Tachysurus ichikawai]
MDTDWGSVGAEDLYHGSGYSSQMPFNYNQLEGRFKQLQAAWLTVRLSVRLLARTSTDTEDSEPEACFVCDEFPAFRPSMIYLLGVMACLGSLTLCSSDGETDAVLADLSKAAEHEEHVLQCSAFLPV